MSTNPPGKADHYGESGAEHRDGHPHARPPSRGFVLHQIRSKRVIHPWEVPSRCPRVRECRLRCTVRGYRRGVRVAWRWLVVGALAISVGLAVWWTTFIFVPAGVVLVGVGATKWARSSRAFTRR
jgi:hypothetical protein